MCVSIIHIESLVNDIESKQGFQKLAYLTLIFDLVTWTFGQLQHLININYVCNYHQDLTNRSQFIGKKFRASQINQPIEQQTFAFLESR